MNKNIKELQKIIEKSSLARWSEEGLKAKLKENYQEEQHKGNIRVLKKTLLNAGYTKEEKQ